MTRRARLMGLGMAVGWLWLSAAPALAQPRATSAHVWGWEQVDPVMTSDLTYEVSIDTQPFAPVLGVACTGATTAICRGNLPQSLTAGRHTAAMRGVRVVDGVVLRGPVTSVLTFDFVTDPRAPGNFRLVPPDVAASVVVEGVAGEPYGYAGLQVVPIDLLSLGAQVFFGALTLATPDYAVQAGDRAAVAFWRP